ANQETLCIAMIETEEGLHNVDAIAGTAGLDAIYLGPADLSLSLGVEFDPGFTDPAIVDAMEKIMMACDKNGIVAGRPTGGPADAQRAIDQGFLFFASASDMSYIRRDVKRSLTQIHELLDRTPQL